MPRCSSPQEVGENGAWARPADPHSTYLTSTQDPHVYPSVNTPLTSLLQPPKSQVHFLTSRYLPKPGLSWPIQPCELLLSRSTLHSSDVSILPDLSQSAFLPFCLCSSCVLRQEAFLFPFLYSNPTDRSKPHTFQPLPSLLPPPHVGANLSHFWVSVALRVKTEHLSSDFNCWSVETFPWLGVLQSTSKYL